MNRIKNITEQPQTEERKVTKGGIILPTKQEIDDVEATRTDFWERLFGRETQN